MHSPIAGNIEQTADILKGPLGSLWISCGCDESSALQMEALCAEDFS